MYPSHTASNHDIAVARFPGGQLYGRLLVFGIGRMVDVLTALNLDVSETAKPAENILAVVGQLIAGALTSGIFFIDGNGQEQIADDRPPPPPGATGIHNLTAAV